ncbi:MAG: hypothetical protein V4438_03535 [Patescibacteria group bacterium]
MNGKQRIGSAAAIVFVTFALAVDLLQILLDVVVIGAVVNRIIDIVVLILFWIAFKLKGVNFTKTRALIFFGLALIELIPGVDVFPLWTIDIIAVIFLVMAEDKLGQTGEALIKNPATRQILKRGIMRGVNKTIDSQPKLRGAIERANKISVQKKSKQNRQNENIDEQKMAA